VTDTRKAAICDVGKQREVHAASVVDRAERTWFWKVFWEMLEPVPEIERTTAWLRPNKQNPQMPFRRDTGESQVGSIDAGPFRPEEDFLTWRLEGSLC